jgi:putative restriction endonuclease
MAIPEFLSHPDWDKPFFKRLPSNDTGAAPGHQGGMVIPKDLRRFFPGLVGRITARTPTIDRRIWADLYDGERFLARVNTRYQFQTWGGERSPESRLTDNLSQLRNLAKADDVLFIQRSLIDLDLYRLTLVRKESASFVSVASLLGRERWGVLGSELPVTEDDFDEALQREMAVEEKPFKLFDDAADLVTSHVTRLARALVFRERVIALYGRTCCLCGTALQVPGGAVELEAAHIVPRALFGVDDARNGLSLCRRHHWAFDRGLFGIDGSRRVFVPQRVLLLAENQPLREFASKPLAEADEQSLRAANAALSWHMENVVLH